MAMSIVRCPFCDRRYNVTGIPSGTKVLCTSCRATLTVPAARPPFRPAWWRRFVPESASAQITVGLIAGLVAATAAYLVIRSRPMPSADAAVAQDRNDPAQPAHRRPREFSGYVHSGLPREEQVRQFTHGIYREFGANRFNIDERRDSQFVIAGEVHPKVTLSVMFDEFQGALNGLQERFRLEFGRPLQLREPSEILPMVVFTSRESFDDYLRGENNAPLPPEVPGVYEYSKQRVVFLYGRNGYPIEVLLHEATHQLFHYHFRQRANRDARQSWWFQEGMATYFEQFVRKPTRVEVDPSLPSSRLPMLRDAAKRSELKPLYQLMGLELDEIWRHSIGRDPSAQQMRSTQLYYAQAWALVHYLRHGAGGKYRAFFDEYVKRELEGRGSKAEFEKLLLERFGIQLQHLERELLEYIGAL